MDVMDENQQDSDSYPGSEATHDENAPNVDANHTSCDEHSCTKTELIPNIFYGDYLCYFCSFLDVVTLSVCAGVSTDFRKVAEFVRKNTHYLTIDVMRNETEYTECVLLKCKKIFCVRIRQTTLTTDQIKSIISKFSDSIFWVFMDEQFTQIICSDRPSFEGDEKFPLKCKDNFLGFLAQTLTFLTRLHLYGCFDADDFLNFAQNENVSNLESLILFSVHRHHEWSDANSAALREGLGMILTRNLYLVDISLRKFHGAAEVVLSDPHANGLRMLFLNNCRVPTAIEKKLREELVDTDVCIDNDDPIGR